MMNYYKNGGFMLAVTISLMFIVGVEKALLIGFLLFILIPFFIKDFKGD